MKKPNAEQIIKAFEICRDQDLCNECIYEENIDCLRLKEKHAIELMKSQGQKIEELTEDNKWCAKRILEADKKVAELTEENERLRAEVSVKKKLLDKCVDLEDKVKADTLREMQDRLTRCIGTYTNKDFVYVGAWFALIDQIAKEMVEGG